MAGISRVMETTAMLRNLHAADIQQGQCFYYNTAVLFFSRNLADHYFHTCVTCALSQAAP
ncbi:MAG: hypothetical protein FDX18_01065 [Chlorobium sp.]|nr:MAG: hypothetical protein FDX18_01065 [Chlorobium sp.]